MLGWLASEKIYYINLHLKIYIPVVSQNKQIKLNYCNARPTTATVVLSAYKSPANSEQRRIDWNIITI
jgi:hypothetical protein